jgi:hypothetical protein
MTSNIQYPNIKKILIKHTIYGAEGGRGGGLPHRTEKLKKNYKKKKTFERQKKKKKKKKKKNAMVRRDAMTGSKLRGFDKGDILRFFPHATRTVVV